MGADSKFGAPVTIRIARLAAATFILLAAVAPARSDDVLAPQVATVTAQLDPRVAQTLARIDGTGRQLLALRSYVRSAPHLPERWSWTQEQITAFDGSPEQRTLQHELDHVRAAFSGDNPGFELYVNPQVRSLEIQIAHWNSNASVAAAAQEILAAAQALVESGSFQRMDVTQMAKAFSHYLSVHTPVPTPTIAAPGLSAHGQMRAIDFQVRRGSRIVAGPSTASIATDWDAEGWAAKLDAAVRRASPALAGTLTSPRAPWHYTYTPKAGATN